MPVRICKTEEILVADNRIRREFPEKDIEELAGDILRNGLLHPPTLRTEQEGKLEDIPDPTFYLVAGERRLRAIKLLQSRDKDFWCDGIIFSAKNALCPFITKGDLSAADALEIELNENLLRTDLDWKDVTAAQAKLHDLRAAQAKEAEKPWSVKDTAEELSRTAGMGQSTAQKAIATARKLADHLDDPELKNARSAREAERILDRKMEGEFHAAYLKALDRERAEEADGGEPSGYLRDLHLFRGDFRDVEIPVGTFDLIIADPPYGVGADKFGDAAVGTHNYEDDMETAFDVAGDIFKEGAAWTKNEAHVFMFCDVELFPTLREISEYHGWKPFRTPLIWYKPGTGHIPWGPDNIRRETELILYASKGNKPLLRLHSDIFNVPKEKSTDFPGARKPPMLYKELMMLTCLPGSMVIDPTCGSGPIFTAARLTGMEAWGIEQDPETHKFAAAELGRAMEL